MRRAREPEGKSAWHRSVPYWLAALFQAASLFSLLGYVLQPVFPHLWRWIFTAFDLLNLSVGRSLFAFAAYLVLALAALRRKRVVVWIFVFVFQVPAILAVLAILIARIALTGRLGGTMVGRVQLYPPWFDILSLLFAIVLVVIVVAARRAFPARLERHAWRRALATLVVGLTVSTAFALALSFVWPGTLRGRGHVIWALQASVGLVPPHARFGTGPVWLSDAAAAISLVALIAAMWAFTRSAGSGRAMSPDDELALRRLLLTSPDPDSLGYFQTRREKSVCFSEDGRGAVCYRVLSGFAIASGNPVGDPAAWPAAISAWMRLVRSYGWTPAVLAADSRAAHAYAAAGLRLMQLGDESVVQVKDFSLDLPAARQLRHEVRRVERAGYTAHVRRQRDIPPDELARLASAADRWRDGKHERGFSMALGRFGDPSDGSCVVVTASDAAGELRGLLSFVPWGRKGLSLDLMRRSPDAAASVVPFMIAKLLGVAGEHGAERVSLNFAMFRHLFEEGEQLGAGPIDRLLLTIAKLASRRWQIESLYRSNERYLPQWSPRLLGYDRGASIAALAVAAARLEGFLPLGTVRLRTRRRAAQAGGARADATVAGRATDTFAAAVRAQEEELATPPIPHRRIGQQQAARMHKLELLRSAGMDPYPVAVERNGTIAQAIERAIGLVAADGGAHPNRDKIAADGGAHLGAASPTRDASRDTLAVAGRIVSLRDHGGLVFLMLREEGAHIQAMARRENTGDFALLRRAVDTGDIVAVAGEPMRTRTGELTIDVTRWQMAAKSLTPMPDKRHGLADPQARLRLRHIDLALSDGARDRLLARSAIVRSLREELHARGFAEVETPILQQVHGGANARPFATHINAYAMDLSLRIAPELALKKLAVGGLERIFEIGRNFRNEGADATHNPEFTSLEAYQAYGDFLTMRTLTQELIQAAAIAVHGRAIAPLADGRELDLSGEWPLIDVAAAVSEATGHPLGPDSSLAEVRAAARSAGVELGGARTVGDAIDTLYGHLVEPVTERPTFYARFPVETSPLTRKDRRDPRLAERWDLVARGMELGTAYSELIDPVDQRARLTEQSLRAAAGDPEAMELDESFLQALEFAMPPTGGLGLGVDRIAMLLLDTNIRGSLAFPFVRPRGR